MTNRYILTGAPGSGKSAILQELETRGKIVVRESAEDIIRLNQAKGIERPWELPDFQIQILNLQLKREERIPRTLGYALLDRGIYDGLAYADKNSEVARRIHEEARKDWRIDYSGVMIVENLGNTATNKIRREGHEEALRLEKKIEGVYRELGYRIERIPVMSVEDRANRVLEIVERWEE